jgi:ketosteroid isomerase-like protein
VAFDAFNRASPKFSTFDVKLTSVAGSGDVAVVSGTFAASAQAGKDPGGKATPAFRDEGSFMQALGKQSDGSWKITRDIWNSSLPTSGGAAAGSK